MAAFHCLCQNPSEEKKNEKKEMENKRQEAIKEEWKSL